MWQSQESGADRPALLELDRYVSLPYSFLFLQEYTFINTNTCPVDIIDCDYLQSNLGLEYFLRLKNETLQEAFIF